MTSPRGAYSSETLIVLELPPIPNVAAPNAVAVEVEVVEGVVALDAATTLLVVNEVGDVNADTPTAKATDANALLAVKINGLSFMVGKGGWFPILPVLIISFLLCQDEKDKEDPKSE